MKAQKKTSQQDNKQLRKSTKYNTKTGNQKWSVEVTQQQKEGSKSGMEN
jgi:hypothetical protein